MPEAAPPLIVLTIADVRRSSDPGLAARKNARYAEAVERHGGRPLLHDGTASDTERSVAFATMDGLLLTGGTDIDPARYGRPNTGSVDVEPDRDALEADAWAAAAGRNVPVFGICRGFQAINVFAGGTLIQDVPGHAGPGWGTGPARMHTIRIEPEGILAQALADGAETVNTYHHQAVTAADLAPGLRATAWAASPAGDIVEALELPGDRFVVGVQCHPERTESSPPAFERLWSAFVAAAADVAATGARRRSPAGGTAASAPRAAR
jgi:gamma-glutamyl-gamma-aminobutyrate hydrolase PuuD